MIIVTASRKAGVSKTTTTLNLAAALRQNGHKVALLDLDPQQDLMSLKRAVKGIQWLDSTLPVQEAVTRSKAAYTLIDCPPRLDTETIEGRATLQALCVADACLIPTPAELLPIRGLARIMTVIEQVQANHNPRLQPHILIAMYQAANKARRDEVRARYGGRLCRVSIPRHSAIVRALDSQQSILTFAPDSTGAGAYLKLAKEVEAWRETPMS